MNLRPGTIMQNFPDHILLFLDVGALFAGECPPIEQRGVTVRNDSCTNLESPNRITMASNKIMMAHIDKPRGLNIFVDIRLTVARIRFIFNQFSEK